MHKDSAYLLFYLRKDVEGKNLAQVFPNIQSDYFVGKPVKLQGSDGFVTGNPTKGGGKKIEIKLKSQPLPSQIS